MARQVALLVVLTLLGTSIASAEDKFFDSKGVRIRYVDEGRGEPIILVHGALGNIESNWIQTGVIKNLSKDHRVVALDMRGHGKSDKPHEQSAYGRHMAEDIVRLLGHLKIPKAHLVGYSFGAVIAGYTISHFQDHFVSVIFGGAVPLIGPWTDAQQRQSEMRANGYEGGSVRGLIERTAEGAGIKLSEKEIQQRESELLQMQDLKAIAAVSRSNGEFALSGETAKKTAIPTLAVVGSDDPAIKAVAEFRKLRPDVGLFVIQGATHAAPRNARARPEFSDAVRQFVALHGSTQRR
jgi:pimeloyl-ACP methyl ester carboxylesterase